MHMAAATNGCPILRSASRQVPVCGPPAFRALRPICTGRSCRCRSRRSARLKPVPPAAAAADLETANDTDWETKYGQSPLEFGIAALQGPRDTMEDCVSVIPQGRCGFLVACEVLKPSPTYPAGPPHLTWQLYRPAEGRCWSAVSLLNTFLLMTAALFDGHGTAAAAERLNESLYSEFSHTIDDQMLNTFDDLEPCELNGALPRQQSPLHFIGSLLIQVAESVTPCKHMQSRN